MPWVLRWVSLVCRSRSFFITCQCRGLQVSSTSDYCQRIGTGSEYNTSVPYLILGEKKRPTSVDADTLSMRTTAPSLFDSLGLLWDYCVFIPVKWYKVFQFASPCESLIRPNGLWGTAHCNSPELRSVSLQTACFVEATVHAWQPRAHLHFWQAGIDLLAFLLEISLEGLVCMLPNWLSKIHVSRFLQLGNKNGDISSCAALAHIIYLLSIVCSIHASTSLNTIYKNHRRDMSPNQANSCTVNHRILSVMYTSFKITLIFRPKNKELWAGWGWSWWCGEQWCLLTTGALPATQRSSAL